MRDLFDQIIAGGESALAQLVSNKQQEGVDLEFKRKANPDTGEASREDRTNLGIALSALSNSMGGVMVWGVRAAKDSEKIDCATELKPIAEISRFKSDVARLVSQAIMPRHEGIMVEAIAASSPLGAGYLVIHVERSERRPHRCEFGDKQYFKRVGDSSIAMEHYDIEDSFKRLVVPWLELKWSVAPGPSEGGPRGHFQTVLVKLHLENPSSVTARFPYVTLTELSGATAPPFLAYPHTPPSVSGEMSRRDDGTAVHFFGGADLVVHPETSLKMVSLETKITVEPRDGRVYVPRGALPRVRCSYKCGCYNSRQTSGEIIAGPDDLMRGILRGYRY